MRIGIICSITSALIGLFLTFMTLENHNLQLLWSLIVGLVTAFIENQKFEITSLRRDVNQQGRHTEIIFTKDWHLDAERRDFTLNAIYLTSK